MVFGLDDILVGGLLGGITAGGTALANSNNIDMMREQNEFNRRQAEINRMFQKDMSSTAYQRAMADMKQAGLNPMLAFQQGGASTPSGSAASGSAAKMENVLGTAVTIMAKKKSWARGLVI